MTDREIIERAHRMAWRYKHSTDPAHSSTYTFNDLCLLDFARWVEAEATLQERERCFGIVINLPWNHLHEFEPEQEDTAKALCFRLASAIRKEPK